MSRNGDGRRVVSGGMAAGTILLVEDEQSIASLVELYLSNEGFAVEHISDGAQALAAVERLRPALVILDVMLPGMDGVEICRRLRRESEDLPIMMLTARDTEVDRVLGLELGADDYVTKPFSPRELVARVKAVLRRSGRAVAADEVPVVLSVGGVEIDEARHEVRTASGDVTLTAKEFDLLAFLARNRGIVFSRDKLLDRVWGYERAVDTRTVDSHVKSLRQKLGGAGSVVKTVRGVGYKVDA
ncbi:MAG: response regulator transcription factor, partial [Actinomycetota bacterium]